MVRVTRGAYDTFIPLRVFLLFFSWSSICPQRLQLNKSLMIYIELWLNVELSRSFALCICQCLCKNAPLTFCASTLCPAVFHQVIDIKSPVPCIKNINRSCKRKTQSIIIMVFYILLLSCSTTANIILCLTLDKNSLDFRRKVT